MLPAYTYKEILRELRNTPRWPTTIKMTGLLFSRPTSTLATTEIIPNLEYFHHRSSNKVHFFCAGYGAYWHADDYNDKISVVEIDGSKWDFSTEKFNQLRNEIEQKTTWRYSGGTDLILFNLQVNHGKQLELDFSVAALFPLDQMKADGVIYGAEMFFENVFRFADNYKGRNAVSDFLDPPDISYIRNSPINIGVLFQRMMDAWKRNDYGGVLHASASIIETMAKHIVGKSTIENQTFKGFFDLYSKHSYLPKSYLDRTLAIYEQRNTTPLAGHGAVSAPQLSRDDAHDLIGFTSDCVRLEYKQRSVMVGV